MNDCFMGLLNLACFIRLLENGVPMRRFEMGSEKIDDELRRMRGKEMAIVFQNVEDALDQDQIEEAIFIHKNATAKSVMAARIFLQSVGLNGYKARAYPQ